MDIKALEEKWKKYWEDNKVYQFSTSEKPIFSIDTPPPTVSGEMHIGHAFSYSQQDFIARFKRMSGFNVFYPFGTDDNGLPTEKLIQKLKGVKSSKMDRDDFINLCLKTIKEITPKFIQDWKDLAISCDYNIYYSTIDDKSRKLSQQYFIDLYKKNLVYLDEFPTIWDTEFQTPVAQAELEDLEKKSLFTTIKFTSSGKTLPIATTRPELLPACLAVFVNPKDKRYKSLIGKKAKVPLFNQEVPIIADESAKMDKGTGILMVCSYGDKYDVEAVKKYKLNPKIILTKDGKLNITKYKGLPSTEARKKILEDLEKSGLIIEQKKITHSVNVYEKSQKEIEFLPTEQWFIKLPEKKKLIEQGKKIKWYPSFMYKRYKSWIEGLEWDWSISRERHFGVPIPAWHCRTCKSIVVAESKELPIDPVQVKKKCKKCNSKLEPETKVLDTWATSSLTPQLAASRTKVNIPYSLRPQAHDIIRTWAFYTIVRALYHNNSIPWKEIAISGFVTRKGEKMSKSKGNAIRPQKIMGEYGADALRFWAASSKLGEDLDYQEKDLITGKKFITKILNATNFVFLNLVYQKKQPTLEKVDKLFLEQLNSLIQKVTKAFEQYNYMKAKQLTEKFFWQNFTDNYLEIVKYRVYNGNKKEQASAFYTLYQSLLTLLKLMAPITPFITEEIYQQHFKKNEKTASIHITEWPKSTSKKTDDKTWNLLLNTIAKVRQAKSKAKKSMKAEIMLTIPAKDKSILKNCLQDLQTVASAKEIKTGKFKVEFI
ncbi:valine--tRNA ligase [Candidatus Pacearchaeota archaeon CG_4_10_14_0_8_um_filter_35_169]|nr:MAG: valine--tRNA ligase [Candidatus Pacearchaeota archaeon CG1_02_35_32]PIY81906.1 MAG: valine--tRNA ligase [Candidatus Pacearchaeota archaeon CG_4_10_14_0_8_um_filter_35_169]